jgi:CheY-like chemotaxis protein
MDASDVNALGGCARVLLVEDDERPAELIAEYLGRNGMELHWVRRGDVAIEKTYAIAPDLVVLDVMLPGLDGFEICRELRARRAVAARAPRGHGAVAQRHPAGAAQPRLRRLGPFRRLPHLPSGCS